MDEETRRRVFEPFFSTEKDVGSGLGLSTVYSAVRRWGGEVEVESAPEQGTSFFFTSRFGPNLKYRKKDRIPKRILCGLNSFA